MDSENYQSLNGNALRLLLDLARQYNGRNNGDLCASRSVLKKRGWNSNNSIHRALVELETRGWIIGTKVGGLGMGCSLYAITWFPIDPCNGKIDISPTKVASNEWKNWTKV